MRSSLTPKLCANGERLMLPFGESSRRLSSDDCIHLWWKARDSTATYTAVSRSNQRIPATGSCTRSWSNGARSSSSQLAEGIGPTPTGALELACLIGDDQS